MVQRLDYFRPEPKPPKSDELNRRAAAGMLGCVVALFVAGVLMLIVALVHEIRSRGPYP